MTTTTELRFQATPSWGEVSAILTMPESARFLYVFAHGAGAGMRHNFMEVASAALAKRGIGTFRYQFPYVERRSRVIDPQPILLATVRSAAAEARKASGGLPLLAGGKSMGGRMTSIASAQEPIEGVHGLVFFGFPLHPSGRPAIVRADHLERVTTPMLFLQGTRDALAGLDLLRPVLERLSGRATLHVVNEADHSFLMPKRLGKGLPETLEDLGDAVRGWADRLDAK